jgi:hypothetical protein
MSEQSPFDDEDESTAVPQNETVLQWAIRVNPDENWDVCCVCGATEDEYTGPIQGLIRGLVLLGDLTLGRAAWCWKSGCLSERYSSVYIPQAMLRS